MWRWNYNGHTISPSSLTPYCPRCSTGVRVELGGYPATTTTFICDECDFVQEVPGDREAVIERIGRLVEREANLGDANTV